MTTANLYFVMHRGSCRETPAFRGAISYGAVSTATGVVTTRVVAAYKCLK